MKKWPALLLNCAVCFGAAQAEAFADVGPTEHEDYLRLPKDFAEDDDREAYVPGEK